MERRNFLGLVVTAPIAPTVTVDIKKLRHLGQVSSLVHCYGGYMMEPAFTRYKLMGFTRIVK